MYYGNVRSHLLEDQVEEIIRSIFYRNERSFYEDFKRISAHVAMSMQKGKHPGGQTQGFPQQRYTHASYPL
ncbi:hypothetical protein L9F63_012239 [Diploptera punctata]|uniref:Uncharacterized protein n=1 Tax=Diploptera punctata TaxID=6984 RepID=A0AAD8ACS8_DIPPU|nr:hypothetical protein L9F63_012239 [Diploptera punctata]